MIKNLLRVAMRNFMRDKWYSMLNILGLTIGITFSMFLIFYIKDELSYDKYNEKADRIYRIASYIKEPDKDTMRWAICPFPMAPALSKDYPEVEEAVRLWGNFGGKTMFKNGGLRFYEDKVFYTDSNLFRVFTHKFIEGDARTSLMAPKSLVLTQSIAEKYFGKNTSYVGKILQNASGDVYKVTAVIKDVPKNSHIIFNALISRSSLPADFANNWGGFSFYTYVLLKPNTNAAAFEDGSNSNGELQTLPNIDINIKTGNSLISRFALDENLKSATPYFEKKILEFKSWVTDYKHEVNREKKRGIQQLIADLKKGFLSKITDRNPTKIKVDKLTKEFLNKYINEKLFSQNLTAEQKKDKERIEKDIEKLNKELEAYVKNPIFHNAFEWRFEFPEVLDNEGNFIGFDVVIGNPPYGVSYNNETKKYLKDRYPGIQQKMFDPFLFFIALSFKLLKESAVTSFIVPNNLIFQMTFEKGREYLINNSSINIVINLGDKVFADADVPTCLYIARKAVKSDYTFDYLDLRENEEKNLFSTYLKFDKFSKTQMLQTHSLVFGVSNVNLNIIKKLSSNSIKFDDIIDVASYGIGTGGDKIFRLKNDYCILQQLETDILYNVISGNNISRFAINYADEKIIYTTKSVDINKYPNILKHLTPFEKNLSNKRETKKGILPWWCLHWARNKNLFLGNKIILRQTGDKITATYDDLSYFVMDSVMVIKVKKDSDFEIKYILALLNSKLSNFLYENIAQEKGRTFAQVKPLNIRQLLIKKINIQEQLPFIQLVNQIINAKKENPKADTSQLENEIDQLVYKLYNLSAEEIKIIEDK